MPFFIAQWALIRLEGLRFECQGTMIYASMGIGKINPDFIPMLLNFKEEKEKQKWGKIYGVWLGMSND